MHVGVGTAMNSSHDDILRPDLARCHPRSASTSRASAYLPADGALTLRGTLTDAAEEILVQGVVGEIR